MSRPVLLDTSFLVALERETAADDIGPAPGENPVGTLYINQRCTKLVKGDMRAVLETRFLRRSGQAEFSGSGKLTVGQFESSTRLELLRPDVPVE